MFVLRISIFEMPAMLSCTSNTMLDRNRPSIGGDRWFGMLVMQQPTRTEIFTNPDEQFDQYMFTLRISPFAMTAMI
jgi:hypothetical protein